MSDISNDVIQNVFSVIKELVDDKSLEINANTPLLGDGSCMDSMKLVELCVRLEDKAIEAGFEFDWTSDCAMSRARSMFKTAGTLTEEFYKQMQDKK